MLKNIKDSLEVSYKQGLESDDNIYIKGQLKDWEEMLSNIKHEQDLKDNALKMYDECQQEIERLNNIINEFEKHLQNEISNGRSEDNVWLMGCYDEDRKILDKLQELKGSDSNE